MIQIEKHESGYTAIVTSTNGEVLWSWSEPISRSSLWAALFALECHQIDVIEAFAAADPEEKEKLKAAADRVIRLNREPGGRARLQKMTHEFQRELHERYGGRDEHQNAVREANERVLQESFGPDEIAKIVRIGKERRSK